MKNIAVLEKFEMTDHLGNIRVSFKDNGVGGLDILSATDYYPFGIELPGSPAFQS